MLLDVLGPLSVPRSSLCRPPGPYDSVILHNEDTVGSIAVAVGSIVIAVGSIAIAMGIIAVAVGGIALTVGSIAVAVGSIDAAVGSATINNRYYYCGGTPGFRAIAVDGNNMRTPPPHEYHSLVPFPYILAACVAGSYLHLNRLGHNCEELPLLVTHACV